MTLVVEINNDRFAPWQRYRNGPIGSENYRKFLQCDRRKTERSLWLIITALILIGSRTCAFLLWDTNKPSSMVVAPRIGADQFHHGRIVKNSRRRTALINGATLRTTVAPVRMDLDINELTIETIPTSSTLSPLRLRTRELRARRVRLLRCLNGTEAQPFRWTSPEGNGDTQHRTDILNRCITFDVHWNRVTFGEVKDSARARERLFRADRSRGNYADLLRSRSHAVNAELSRRQCS